MFKNIRPMLLKEKEKPFNDNNYLYEIKFDGIRAIIYISDKVFKIVSRNNIDITDKYGELKNIKKLFKGKKVILDGEIVVLDNGKPSFLKLMSKDRGEVTFVCFDILYEDRNLMNEPLIVRKEILNKYQDNDYFIKSKCFFDGVKLFKVVKKMGLEGIVAKEKNSLYIPGERVDFWIKIKNLREGYFFVHGYQFNKIKYSLFLGEFKKDKLYYVGKVSVMPDNIILKDILKEKKYPNLFENFKGEVFYIEPKVQVLVSYLEKTIDDKLRQPVIKKS